MSTFHRILLCSSVVLFAVFASAQSDRDLESKCRNEAARRFNISRDSISAQMSGWDNNQARVQWRNNNRNGYCVIDRHMNVVDFKDFGQGGNDRWDNNAGDNNRWDDDRRWTPISNYPRVKVDTDGHGSFTRNNESLRIKRGYVDTKGTPSITLSCEHDYRVTFRGDVVRQNGDREFTIRFTSADRGDARGMATFRLNRDKNEVEFISVEGQLNGRPVQATFDRND